MNKQQLKVHIRPLRPLKTALKPGGRLKAPVRCVLFDIYGTLFISASGDISLARKDAPPREAIADLLAKFNVHQTPEELMGALHAAIEFRHAELRKQGVDFPEVEIDRIWAQVLKFSDMEVVRQFALEFELIVNPVFPMPHLEQMLADCRARQLVMGIISNAQFYTPSLFILFFSLSPEQVGFNKDLVFYSYEYGRAKPSPNLFSMAAKKLLAKDIAPAEVVYLGNDMRNDIWPAHSAGFQTALFAGDRRSLRLRRDEPRCRDLTPDLVITDLNQLIAAIDQAARVK